MEKSLNFVVFGVAFGLESATSQLTLLLYLLEESVVFFFLRSLVSC